LGALDALGALDSLGALSMMVVGLFLEMNRMMPALR
jgi:hypothetical protein